MLDQQSYWTNLLVESNIHYGEVIFTDKILAFQFFVELTQYDFKQIHLCIFDILISWLLQSICFIPNRIADNQSARWSKNAFQPSHRHFKKSSVFLREVSSHQLTRLIFVHDVHDECLSASQYFVTSIYNHGDLLQGTNLCIAFTLVFSLECVDLLKVVLDFT